MLTHTQASFSVGQCVEKMLAFMRRHGQHFPVLYALNKGKPIDVSAAVNDSVLTQDHEDKHAGDPAYRVYRSAMGFQLRGPEDEANIQKAADKLAKELDPDAVAIIIACLYAEYDEGEKKPETLDAEPDAYKILHVCYWLREDPVPRVMTVPYAMNEEGQLESLEWNSMDENQTNYGVAAAVFAWSKPPKKMKTQIMDPYREMRK